MTASRRAVVALFLLLTIPLRAMAAVAMPCCPLPDPATATHAMHGMDADAAMAVDDDAAPATPLAAGDGHRPLQPVACCVTAMIASTPVAQAMPHAAPIAIEAGFAAIAPFFTDAPERPPRLPILSA